MKVANIIVAHTNPNQLLRLVSQFDSRYFHNFVHVDAKADINQYKSVVGHPSVTMLPRTSVVWAGYSFTKVVINALKIITASKDHYSYISLLSGMDFPIRPTTELHDYLENAYKQGPKEFFDIVDLSNWPGKHRYERYHLSEWTIKGRYFTERIINLFISKRKFWGGLEPFGYATWFTASDKFIAYALNYFEENPGYLKFLKTTWCADEFVFNTLLMNSSFKSNYAGHSLRYVDWSEGKVHPKLFRADDYDKIVSSEMFLARKFNESIDKEIVDKLEIRNSQSVIRN
jgi:hypothetical protein